MKNPKIVPSQMRVGFSLKKEVFFVMLASVIGAIFMHAPRIIAGHENFTQYKITLLVIARTVGSESFELGFIIHIGVAVVIGITTGVLLYKVLKFNILSFVHATAYGLLSGLVVFAVFAIPVATLILMPNGASVIQMINETGMFGPGRTESISLISGIADMFVMHIIWGLVLGVVSLCLTRAWGTNYRCHICDVEFSKESTCRKHILHIHENPRPQLKKILILGCGYGGIGVLQRVQKMFDVHVSIMFSFCILDGHWNVIIATVRVEKHEIICICMRHLASESTWQLELQILQIRLDLKVIRMLLRAQMIKC